MTDQEWKAIVLSKVEKIEEQQASLVESFYAHKVEIEKQNSIIVQGNVHLKERVNLLWSAFLFVVGTTLTIVVGKKL